MFVGQPKEEHRERVRRRALPGYVVDTPYADYCPKHGGTGDERWCALCFMEAKHGQ